MSVEETVTTIRDQLEDLLESSSEDCSDEALPFLKQLMSFEIDFSVLTSTRIGKTVNKLRARIKDRAAVKLGRSLIKQWRKFLPEEGSDREDDGGVLGKKKKARKGEKRKKSRGSEQAKEEVEESMSKKVKVEVESSSEAVISTECSEDNSSKVLITEGDATTDPVRLKSRELLTAALQGDGNLPDGTNDPEFLAEQLEAKIFKEFKNTEIKYKNRIRSRLANLKDRRNPNLRLSFLVGDISPGRMAVMSAEEMASDELKMLRLQFDQEAILKSQLATQEGTKTDLLKCGKCKKRNCTYNQLQTRSADEPMTTFVLCNYCGHRWKFN